MIEEQEFAAALGRQRDLMDRLIVVEGVAERDRVSGEAFTHAALTIGLECACGADGWCDLTAEAIGQGVFSIRVMRRVIALMNSLGLLDQESFRWDGSPRTRRRVHWTKYLEFVDSIRSREDCVRERAPKTFRLERKLRCMDLQAQAAEPVAMPCTCEGIDYVAC